MDEFILNLDTSSGHEGHRRIFAVSGPAGAGKSYLLRQFRAAATRIDAPTAWSDEFDTDVLATLRTMVSEFSEPDAFEEYLGLDRRYNELLSKILLSADAPPGLDLVLSQGLSRGLLALGRQVPGLGLPLAFVDDDALAPEAQKAISFVRASVGNDKDFSLLLEPLTRLTSAFVTGLQRLGATERPVAIFLDAFERRSSFLETWLLQLVGEQFGRLPPSLVVTVGGQRSLSPVTWSGYESLIRRILLDVFTEQEAVDVLNAMGVRDPEIILYMKSLSGRLPVLLAMLGAQKPASVGDIRGLPSDAIEVFLSSITDPARRDLAIAGALPRWLNEDVMSVVSKEATTTDDWDWLRQQTFVQELQDGWRYHEVARRLLLQQKRKESPDDWAKLHGELESHFAARLTQIAGDRGEPVADSRWRAAYAEYIYHRLCGHPERIARVVLRCLRANDEAGSFARTLAYAIQDAGQDADDALLARWGSNCKELLESADERIRLRILDSLLAWNDPTIIENRAYLRRKRGILLSDMGRYDDAISSFRGSATLKPQEPLYHVDIAITQSRAERFTQAVASIDAAFERSGGKDDEWVADLYSLRADYLRRDGRAAEALEDADKAVDMNAATARPYDVRGRIHIELQEPDLALADFEQGMAVDPRYEHSGLQMMGTLLTNVDRLDAAERNLVRALEISPNCEHCWQALILVAQKRGKLEAPDLAAYGLDERLSISGRFRRSRALGNAGFFEAAVADFDDVFGTDPARIPPGALNDYGLWLTYLDRMSDAATVYRETLRRTPGNAITLYNLAVVTAFAAGVAAAQDEIAAAREALYRLDMGRDSPERAYGLAGLAAVEDQLEEAFTGLHTAALLKPDVVRDWAEKDCAWRGRREDPRFEAALTAPGS